MTTLTQTERDQFLREHLRHRLTLLRTLRERKKCGYKYGGQGDIYRCVKDSNLIAVRIILDFLGLKGEFDGSDYKLTPSPRQPGAKFADDVKIDQFIGRLLMPTDVPASSQPVLAGVYKRADKELAHLTSTFNEKFNEESALIEAATAVEDLLQRFLYTSLGEKLPQIDT